MTIDNDTQPHGPVKQFYNDNAGLGFETIQGPYIFNGSMGVYGIKADEDQLSHFVSEYLNSTLTGSNISFELGGSSTVFLVFTDFDSLKGAKNRGVFRNSSVHFHIPVVCHMPKAIADAKGIPGEPDTDTDMLRVKGSIQVFSFGAIMLNVITSNEVRGPTMRHAKMHADGIWLEDLHPAAAKKELVDVKSELLSKGGGEVKKHSVIVLHNNAKELDPNATKKKQPRLKTKDVKEHIATIKEHAGDIVGILEGFIAIETKAKVRPKNLTEVISGKSKLIAAIWNVTVRSKPELFPYTMTELTKASELDELFTWLEVNSNRQALKDLILGIRRKYSEDENQAQNTFTLGANGRRQLGSTDRSEQEVEANATQFFEGMLESIFEYLKGKIVEWGIADAQTVFALKQFPFEGDPSKACYQSLVLIGHGVKYPENTDSIPNFRKWLNIFWQTNPGWDLSLPQNANDSRIEQSKIDIHKNIVDSLGLAGIPITDSDLCRCQPVMYARVFTGDDPEKMVFTEELGKTLCYRYDTLDDVSPDRKNGWICPPFQDQS